MGTTTFDGPIKAGTIFNTTGTTVGKDVSNVGYGVCIQSDTLLYTDLTDKETSIYLPKDTQILAIEVNVTEAWDSLSSVSGTSPFTAYGQFSVGDSGLFNRYCDAYGDRAEYDQGVLCYPLGRKGNWISGNDMVVSNWYNVTKTSGISGDVRLTMRANDTGSTTGKLRINVLYVPGRNLSAPTAWGQ